MTLSSYATSKLTEEKVFKKSNSSIYPRTGSIDLGLN